MQAIITKYHGPTNRMRSRISATAAVGRIYVKYDHTISVERNHNAAAQALAYKYEWTGELVHGELPNHDRVHVFVESRT